MDCNLKREASALATALQSIEKMFPVAISTEKPAPSPPELLFGFFALRAGCNLNREAPALATGYPLIWVDTEALLQSQPRSAPSNHYVVNGGGGKSQQSFNLSREAPPLATASLYCIPINRGRFQSQPRSAPSSHLMDFSTDLAPGVEVSISAEKRPL